MTPIQQITERINRNGDVNNPQTPRPLLTLEEFFEGNDCVGSIGCNLTPTPSPAEFYDLLKKIRGRDDVADVLVEVTMHDDLNSWPFSDTVWIITTAAPGEVAEWFDECVRPDDLFHDWNDGQEREWYTVPTGMIPIGASTT